ncbi:uncharacterized protein MELLADRAFT_117551 [Melampsora larici-populina 98AG31]|uniref:Uncharacterized protein n=1 Tax=Melampsora larici-populina (strain 98AG31 / pathotype 3-4-7) TaxID=747676 RepID=F4RYN8_MELLP|nr:uncharacterized protein MELLADRAFT_117551 [Melampsora larici-populina 98AG31]EGG02504.1 hypothetical protein MELLADRAFT_117551 [Melampsora larici-populina 98AG31]
MTNPTNQLDHQLLKNLDDRQQENNDQDNETNKKVKSILKTLEIEQIDQESIIKKILESYQSTGINSDSECYSTLASQVSIHDQLSNYLDLNLYQYLHHPDHSVKSDAELDSNQSNQFLHLRSHLQSSQDTLKSLTDFLNLFQSDLSTVSSSIADLQARSKLLETRLDARRSSLNILTPYISQTIIPPDLINLIVESNPSSKWFQPISLLEFHLSKIRSSTTTTKENHPTLMIVDKLCLLAAFKIRTFFLNALKPFRTSISTNLQITQASVFLKHRSLFGFLQRCAARTAHEVQKAYLGTIRWYLETGLRRYVRALDKIRARGWIKLGAIGVISPGFQSTTLPLPDSIIHQAFIEGPDIILAYMADPNDFKQSPEALFRSLSLVVIDNIGVEYQFVKNFFGLPLPQQDQNQEQEVGSFQTRLNSRSRASSISHPVPARRGSSITPHQPHHPRPPPSIISSFTDSEFNGSLDSDHQPALDHVWKQIVAPVLEYHKTFTTKILESSIDTTSLYAMIKLNERLIKSVSKSNQNPIENHLISLKLSIWPFFQTSLNLEKESIKKLIGSKNFDGLMKIGKKYGRFVFILVGVCDQVILETQGGEEEGEMGEVGKKEKEEEEQRKEEEQKVFRELGLIREMIDKFIEDESKVKDKKAKIEKFYHEILDEILSHSFSHFYLQGELAHWKEMLRRIQNL